MRRFFGLTPEHRADLLEQHYFLMRHLSFTFTETQRLPVMYRRWFVDRYIREIEERNSSARRAQADAQATSSALGALEQRINRMSKSF